MKCSDELFEQYIPTFVNLFKIAKLAHNNKLDCQPMISDISSFVIKLYKDSEKTKSDVSELQKRVKYLEKKRKEDTKKFNKTLSSIKNIIKTEINCNYFY